MLRPVVAAIAVLGALSLPAGAGAAMYWGGTVHGETYGEFGAAPLNKTVWDTFERHAGKQVTMLSMGQRWEDFETEKFQAAREGGAIPLVVMALPEGATLSEVAAGDHDATIRAWAKEAKAWSHPFLFAPWWEMNGGWYPWGRDPSFKDAWRRFHDIVAEEGATNVTWAWVPNSIWFDPGSDPGPYYPGAAYVDWVGFDVYNWGLNPLQPDRWLSPAQTLTPMLKRLKELAPGKPIVIAENASTEIGGNKAAWIEDLLTSYLPHHPEVKAYVWFNWNVFQNGGRFDWPIESSLPSQQAFRNGIQSSLYRDWLPPLAPLAKVPVPPAPAPGAPQPLDLSPPGLEAGAPRVVAGKDGAATIVWERFDGSDFVVEGRRINADGSVRGGVRGLSSSGGNAFAPQVAVGPDGVASVVWIRFDGSAFVVQERRLGSANPVTNTLSADGRNAAEPEVAIGPDGTATVVWSRFDGSRFIVQARRVDPTGVPEPGTLNLSAPGENAGEPRVAVAGDGTATVAWTRFDGEKEVVQARRISPDGALGATTHDLSAAGQDAGQPQLAVAPDGRATVVWNRSNGTDTIVQARTIAPNGSLEPTTFDLSASGRSAAEPEIALGPGGAGAVVWTRFDGSDLRVQARRMAGGVPQGSTHTLSASGADAAEPHVAVDPAGGSIVVWSRFDGSDFRVQERRLAADGAPEAATRTLSTTAQPASAPEVAPRGSAAATVVWRRSDGANDVAQGTIVPPPPPPPSTLPPTPPTPGADAGSGTTDRGPGGDGADDQSSALLSIGRPKLNKRRGTASLPVTASGPGVLSLTGAGVASLEAAARAGTTRVQVKARGKARRALSRRGRVKVTIKIFLTTTQGSAWRTKTLTLRISAPSWLRPRPL